MVCLYIQKFKLKVESGKVENCSLVCGVKNVPQNTLKCNCKNSVDTSQGQGMEMLMTQDVCGT